MTQKVLQFVYWIVAEVIVYEYFCLGFTVSSTRVSLSLYLGGGGVRQSSRNLRDDYVVTCPFLPFVPFRFYHHRTS